ncbi:MAG TPA: hypothetical protein VI814_11975 [Candidatus Limnocylindria bacterium]
MDEGTKAPGRTRPARRRMKAPVEHHAPRRVEERHAPPSVEEPRAETGGGSFGGGTVDDDDGHRKPERPNDDSKKLLVVLGLLALGAGVMSARLVATAQRRQSALRR